MVIKIWPLIPLKGQLTFHLLLASLSIGHHAESAKIGIPDTRTDLCNSQIYCQGELLKTVQLSKIFNDSKTFVDLYQLHDPNTTLSNFDILMNQTGGKPNQTQVRQFVIQNFAQQDELVNWAPPDWKENPDFINRVQDEKFKDWVKELNEIWKILAKKTSPAVAKNPDRYSLINVNNGFIIPGGRFKEIYYWDSYWVIEGLLLTGMKDTARGIIENFLSMVSRFGFIPNGSRIYYLMRSQPPLLIPMMKLYLEHTNDTQFILNNLYTLEKEFAYFQREKSVDVMKNGKTYRMAHYIVSSEGPRPESYREDYDLAQNLLNDQEKKRFYEDLKAGAESGWDFSSRWLISKQGGIGGLADISTRNVIPVDLNAFLQRNARLLSEFNLLDGNITKAKYYRDIAIQYQLGIDNVLWNEKEGMWFDYDIKNSRPRNTFYPSNLTPLYTKSYDIVKAQIYANKVVAYLKRIKIDDYMGGTPASNINTGEQWDLPNAWPPLQSIIVQGLRKTGKEPAISLAETLAVRWLRANYRGFSRTGEMFEKYDALHPGEFGGGGEYVVQAGFGWTNGVVLEFLNTYPTVNSTSDVDPDYCDNCISDLR